MASAHGVSCSALPGWAQIESPAQCQQAANAFNLPTRKEPYSMQFQGKTWYLVRRAAGDTWHQATDDLQQLEFDPAGSVVLSAKINSCPSMQLKAVQLCYAATGDYLPGQDLTSNCLDLTKDYISEKAYSCILQRPPGEEW